MHEGGHAFSKIAYEHADMASEYVYTDIHTHTYVHEGMHACTHTYIHTCIHTYIESICILELSCVWFRIYRKVSSETLTKTLPRCGIQRNCSFLLLTGFGNLTCLGFQIFLFGRCIPLPVSVIAFVVFAVLCGRCLYLDACVCACLCDLVMQVLVTVHRVFVMVAAVSPPSLLFLVSLMCCCCCCCCRCCCCCCC